MEQAPPRPKNEQEYIELCDHFKTLYEKLKDENKELKKLLLVCYGLFRVHNEDFEFDTSEIGRSVCSDFLDNYVFDAS